MEMDAQGRDIMIRARSELCNKPARPQSLRLTVSAFEEWNATSERWGVASLSDGPAPRRWTLAAVFVPSQGGRFICCGCAGNGIVSWQLRTPYVLEEGGPLWRK